MTDVSDVTGASGAGATDSSGGMQFVSPDTLLEFCRQQLGDFDNQITTQMTSQNTQLQEREAVENVETVLQSFGSAGPSGNDATKQMQKCWDAFSQAIGSLPGDDPVASQLAAQQQALTTNYGFLPQSMVGNTNGAQLIEEPASMTNAPSGDEWKGTTDAVSGLAGDIKSNADIQMLQLQDLVSQRQQIVELTTGIMTKADQTLEDQAKAVGG